MIPALIVGGVLLFGGGIATGVSLNKQKTHKILDVHADHGDMIEGATAFMEKRDPNWAPFDGKGVDIS